MTRGGACPFCAVDAGQVLLRGERCLVLDTRDPVLVGSVMIIPRAHRVTPFDLTPEEWTETGQLLRRIKALLDERLAPDGYNVGWNCGDVGGQVVMHAHLHVIPRHRDEPLAGKGIRHWLKQPANARPPG